MPTTPSRWAPRSTGSCARTSALGSEGPTYGWSNGGMVRLPLALADGFAIGGIDPENIVAVALDDQLDGAGLFDIDEVIGIFERQSAAVIDVEERLHLPVARGRKNIEPDAHGLGAGRIQVLSAGAGVRVGDVLAVHGGVPQAVAEGGGVDIVRAGLPRPAVFAAEVPVDKGHRVELVFDGAEVVVRGAVGNEVHPVVIEQRRGGEQRAGGAGMLVGIGLVEGGAEFLEQGAAVGGAFELIDGLPELGR